MDVDVDVGVVGSLEYAMRVVVFMCTYVVHG
jgi:hypothetical protein